MASRRGRSRGGLFVLIGFLSIIGVTFGVGVYTGRIWMARSVVTPMRVESETRRAPARRAVMPPPPAMPQLSFYHELTAPLTPPPPPPKPAKTPPPPLVTTPTTQPPAALARPGEQADMLAATTTPRTAGTTGPRFTVQVASYRLRPHAEALRDALASAGHDARVVEGEAHGPVYRVQIGEFPTREAARAVATRLTGERSSVAPIVTTR